MDETYVRHILTLRVTVLHLLKNYLALKAPVFVQFSSSSPINMGWNHVLYFIHLFWEIVPLIYLPRLEYYFGKEV